MLKWVKGMFAEMGEETGTVNGSATLGNGSLSTEASSLESRVAEESIPSQANGRGRFHSVSVGNQCMQLDLTNFQCLTTRRARLHVRA